MINLEQRFFVRYFIALEVNWWTSRTSKNTWIYFKKMCTANEIKLSSKLESLYSIINVQTMTKNPCKIRHPTPSTQALA